MAVPDTHTHVKRLQEAGFTEAQAEGLVRVWLDGMQADLATKQDLKELTFTSRQEVKNLATELRQEMKNLATELRQEMKDLTTELRQEMKDLEIRLLKWTVTLLFLQTGLIVALIKLLPGPTG